jgi:hypothetical protein
MTDTPVRVTVTGEEHTETGMHGRTGTALAYFRDSEGRPWAAVELDPEGEPGPSIRIFHQFSIREDRTA